MSTIKTYKGKLPIGQQEKIHLSTNDGLTGYKLKKFQIINQTPGTSNNVSLVGKIFLTDQTGNITSTIDFNDTDLIGCAFFTQATASNTVSYENIIMDKETFNQNIFIYIADASGSTDPANFYLELEQFKIDINSSTYHTLKNIRSRTQLGI